MNEEYTSQKEANRHGLILMILLLIAFLTASLAITYAIVHNVTKNSSEVKIANWSIIVNGQDISKNKTFPISEFSWNKSNTKDNMIAPGSIGTSQMTIKNNSNVKSKINITYSIVNDNKVIDNESLKLTLSENSFDLDKDKSKDLDIKLEWLDLEDNDSNDTYIGQNIDNINIIFNIDAEQIKDN